MFKTLLSSKKKSDVLKNFKKNVIINFGPGSNYWKNLKLRKNNKKVEMEKTYEWSMDSPEYLRDYSKY